METKARARVLVVGATPEQAAEKNAVREILSLFDPGLREIDFTGFAVDPMCAANASTAGGLTSAKCSVAQFADYYAARSPKPPRFDYAVFDHGVAYQVGDIDLVIKKLAGFSDNIVVPYNGYAMCNTPDPEDATMWSRNAPAPHAPLFPSLLTREGDRDEVCDIDVSDRDCVFNKKHCVL